MDITPLEAKLIDQAASIIAASTTPATDDFWVKGAAYLQVLGQDRAGLSGNTLAACSAVLGSVNARLAA